MFPEFQDSLVGHVLFIEACRERDLERVKAIVSDISNKEFMSNSYTNVYYFLRLVYTDTFDESHLEIVKYLLSQGAHVNMGLYYACKTNNLELAKSCKYSGAYGFGRGLLLACESGHLELAEFCVESGATAFNEGFMEACRAGYLELARFIKFVSSIPMRSINYLDVSDFNNGLITACQYNHLGIAKFCIESGAIDFSNGLIKACENGNLELAELCVASFAELNSKLIKNKWNDYIYLPAKL